MTTCYFLISIFHGWVAYNLYRPCRKRQYGSIISFGFGFIVGEALPHILVFQLFITMVFALAGAIHGFWGNLGLLIHLVAWAVMLNHYRTSFRAREAMERAIGSALSRFDPKGIDPTLPSISSKVLEMERLAKPWILDRSDVSRIKDIQYDIIDGIRLKLDIYRHRARPENCPVLFQIHGGGWTYRWGSKNEQARPLMNHMAAKGWICVSVDYRLSPRATFPEHLIDCKKAFAWVKKNIQQWGGNPEFVVVTGGSAGGHLSSLFALTANDPQFQPGFEEVDTSVQGCVPYYGVYDFRDSFSLQANPALYRVIRRNVMKVSKRDDREAYENASPLFRIHEEAPPFLIIQGDCDTLVSVPEARKFAVVLREKSKQPVAYAEIEGAQHGFDMFPSIRSEYVKLGIECFAEHLYGRYLKTQKVEPESTESWSAIGTRQLGAFAPPPQKSVPESPETPT